MFTVFSETLIELATVASNGTKMPRADWKFLKKVELLVPSHELCERFQMQFDAQFSQIVTLLRANESLGAWGQGRTVLATKMHEKRRRESRGPVRTTANIPSIRPA